MEISGGGLNLQEKADKCEFLRRPTCKSCTPTERKQERGKAFHLRTTITLSVLILSLLTDELAEGGKENLRTKASQSPEDGPPKTVFCTKPKREQLP